MTEAEWLACKRSSTMLFWLDSRKPSERRIMLFLASAWRDPRYQYPEATIRFADALDHFVDGAMSREVFNTRYRESGGDSEAETLLPFTPENAHFWIATTRPACKRACRLLRDIFGNPFRLVTFSPSWRTDTAVSLARGMYESRDFGAMPILADALQDAGCDSDDILNHCRDSLAMHVRGCWAVDLVLGKE